jgi:adenine deaminase
MATLNTANHYAPYFRQIKLAGMGEIREGYRANLVVMDSLESLKVGTVIQDGRIRVREGRLIERRFSYDYGEFYDRVNIGRNLESEDFAIHTESDQKRARVRVIDVISNSIVTGLETINIDIKSRKLKADSSRDIAKIAVFERHHASGSHSIGFVRGLGIRRGAIASTIAHDSHNIIVAGADDRSMARAVNHLAEKGGGMVVVDDKIDYFPLKLCGLMSDEPLERVVRGYSQIRDRARKIGSGLNNTFMTMAFLALPVIPRLKITDKGLVDVDAFEFVDLVQQS